MAMFVLEAGGQPGQSERDRSAERQPCRLVGTVCGDDRTSLAHTIVYVRDVANRHMGFISQKDLPVGKTVWLQCPTDDGRTLHTTCQVARSRQFMTGWNEGVLRVCE